MIAFEDAKVVIEEYRRIYKKRLEPYEVGESNDEIGYCNSALNMLNEIESFLKLLDSLDKLRYVTNDLPKNVLKVIDKTTVDYRLIKALIDKWESAEGD